MHNVARIASLIDRICSLAGETLYSCTTEMSDHISIVSSISTAVK